MCDYEREHTPQRDSANAENGKREDNLSRARQTVRRIIWQNMTPHTKFLTLTCEDICLDKKVFMRRLTTFFQAMSRQGYDLRSYDMGGTQIHQIIDYAQGKFKNTQHAVQHSDFTEITTDE